jgi:hypothetical protein
MYVGRVRTLTMRRAYHITKSGQHTECRPPSIGTITVRLVPMHSEHRRPYMDSPHYVTLDADGDSFHITPISYCTYMGRVRTLMARRVITVW